MIRRLGLSLVAHAVAAALLLLGHHLIGQRRLDEPPDPARIEIELGRGGSGDTDRAPAIAETPEPAGTPDPAPPPDPAPTPDTAPATVEAVPTPAEALAAPVPVPPAPVPPAPEPPAPTVSAVVPPARLGSPPAVNLGDGAGRPYADLLDPDQTRFRAAAQATGNLPPAYPAAAAARLESGTVKLQLFVDATGRVTNVLILRSSGSASLDQAARERLGTWRFTPAQRDGQNVPDVVDFEITFQLL